MNEELITAFELCLQEIRRGAALEECLQNYPEIAEDLQPYLEAAIAAHSLSISKVPSDVINRSRTRLLGHAARLRVENPSRKSFTRFPMIVFSALMLALVLILASRELLVVSAESLPGDSLYPIKRAVQDIHVRLAPNLEAKHEIETQYREQRIEEVINLLAIGRIELVSFDGVVSQISPTRWTVDGITVILNEDTKVVGNISLGSLIEVEGITTIDGWIEAHELHLREYEFTGQVEAIEVDFWLISNIKFEIIPSTQIYSGSQIGDDVLVLVRTRDDGNQYALAIISLPSYIEFPGSSNGDVASLTAGKNLGEELEFSGHVEFISSSYWIIDGYTVYMSLITEVKEDIKLGDFVNVHALINEDGSLTAREVKWGIDEAGDEQIKDSEDLDGDSFENDKGTDDDSDQNSQEGDLDQEDDPDELKDSGENGEDGDNDDGGEIDGISNGGIGEQEDESSGGDSRSSDDYNDESSSDGDEGVDKDKGDEGVGGDSDDVIGDDYKPDEPIETPELDD